MSYTSSFKHICAIKRYLIGPLHPIFFAALSMTSTARITTPMAIATRAATTQSASGMAWTVPATCLRS